MKRDKGKIINMSFIAGVSAGAGGTTYTTNKFAVSGMTQQFRLEYAPKGLNINAIAPGSIATPMIKKSLENDPDGYSKRVSKIPAGRLGKPEDIANATVFLASYDSDFVNGHILSVDGGRNALG